MQKPIQYLKSKVPSMYINILVIGFSRIYYISSIYIDHKAHIQFLQITCEILHNVIASLSLHKLI